MSIQNGVDNDDAIQFSWGKRTGKSPDKKSQFYDSFTYDGVEYHKYDCVFISNEPELPYIGKIIKIWEQEDEKRKKQAKRVKILWFFRPTEISAYLDNIPVLENEIFLASGKGEGLFNVNPLEVIAGKVNVICTSKDERNFQPSDEDLKMADYIFYRTFDVGSLKISDKIDDAIAGVEGTLLLNRMDLKHHDEFNKDGGPGTGKSSDRPPKILADGKNGEPVMQGIESADVVKVKPEELGKDDKPAMQGVESGAIKVKPEEFGKDDKPDRGKPSDKSSMKLKLSSDGKNNEGVEADRVKVKCEVLEMKSSSDARNVRLDKQRVDSDGAKFKPGIDSNGLEKGISRSISINEKQAKPSDRLKKASPDHNKDKKNDSDPVEVTRRPETERSKWFRELPWDEQIENAYDQGKLVMLDNLDPDYSKADVEDILYHAVNQNCSVRLIEQSSFTNPNYGQALVIFKTSDLADMAVRKLNSEFLLLPNGRPLLASKGITRSPKKKSYSLIGGPLSMDKYTKMRKIKEEARGAASASHYSQHNTIEYEMAMEWMFLDHKSSCWWEELHKVHQKEIKQAASHLKTK